MEQAKIVSTVNGDKGDKYRDYKRLSFRIRLLDRALGAAPDPKDPSSRKVCFERNGKSIVLRAKNFRAVTRAALKLSNLNLPKVTIQNFFFEDSHPEKTKRGRLALPSPPRYRGAQGTGITIYETLEPGTVIPVKMLVPTSVISTKKVLEAWKIAGPTIRFSPAKSHMGYGRFEVMRT